MSKTILVPKNANMFYKVSKDGYESVASNVIMDSDKVINVELNQLPVPVQLTATFSSYYSMSDDINIYENDVLIKTINLDDDLSKTVTVDVMSGSTVKITSNYNYNWYISSSSNITFTPNYQSNYKTNNTMETEAIIASTESMSVNFGFCWSDPL